MHLVGDLSLAERRKLQQTYGLEEMKEPMSGVEQHETTHTKTKKDPALQVLEGMRESFQGMEDAAKEMARSSKSESYWDTAKHTLKVCSVAIPAAAVALFGTLWAAKKVL